MPEVYEQSFPRMLLSDGDCHLVITTESSWDNIHNCNIDIDGCNLPRRTREKEKTGG